MEFNFRCDYCVDVQKILEQFCASTIEVGEIKRFEFLFNFWCSLEMFKVDGWKNF